MKTHTITIDGKRIRFELYPVAEGNLRCEVAGVVPFYVASVEEARTILRSVFSKAGSK